MSNEELLEYRVAQLEKERDERKGRPVTTATIVMAICALANTAGTIFLVTGGGGK